MVQILLAIGAGIAFIIKFIKGILIKYVTHGVVLTLQFAITASTIVFVMAFYALFISSIVYVYNLGFDVLTMASSGSGFDGVDCFYGLLNCIGAVPAFQNGFTIFMGAISSVALFHLTKFTYGAFRVIANEIFKLGVLLGQAVN
jgi:hypothetical protein